MKQKETTFYSNALLGGYNYGLVMHRCPLAAGLRRPRAAPCAFSAADAGRAITRVHRCVLVLGSKLRNVGRSGYRAWHAEVRVYSGPPTARGEGMAARHSAQHVL